MGIEIDGVEIAVEGDFAGRGSPSSPIAVSMTVRSSAPEERLGELVAEVERVAEIPRSIRESTRIEVTTTVEAPSR
jgi:hypothetical protein